MIREITSEELIKLRSDQWSKLGLFIHKPAIVYSARVNQSTFVDPLLQVTYDGGSGTLSNIIVGMTMYVGSTAGAYDIGLVRIRKTPTSTIFYINEDSEITWVDNAYLTVVDDLGLWSKHLNIIGDLDYLIDSDIAYSDQHTNLNPYVVMGSHRVVKFIENYAEIHGDALRSWVLGSTITGYLWTAPGASYTAGLSTATPTIRYSATGTYRISCTVTAANSKTTTSYRYVRVYSDNDPLISSFQLNYCGGAYEEGGWNMMITLLGEADSSNVRDRALCILVSEDSPEVGGPLPGSENIVAMGWIQGESINWKPPSSTVEFTVLGPQGWLKEISGYPVGVEDADAPTHWWQMKDLNIDRGLFHLLYWRSTASVCIDVILSGDTKLAYTCEASIGTLWDQIVEVAERSILAKPLVDRYGTLHVQVDTQYLGLINRGNIPTIMKITKNDWGGQIRIERRPTNRVSTMEISGIQYDGTDYAPIFSQAKGISMGRYGRVDSLDSLLFANQTDANQLSGLLYAQRNNEYPVVDVPLSMNNRYLDICPRGYIKIDLEASDNPRGIVWNNKKFLIRRVDHTYTEKEGALRTNIELEAETSGPSGITIIMPPPNWNGDYNFEVPGFGDWGAWYPYLPIGIPDPPPVVPPEPPPPYGGATCPVDAPANGPLVFALNKTIYGTGTYFFPIYLSPFEYPGTWNGVWIRTSSHNNKTKYEITGNFGKFNFTTGQWEDTLEDNFYQVYAYDYSGNLVATGIHDPVTDPHKRTGTLNASVVTQIWKIVIMITADLINPSSVSQHLHSHPWNTRINGTLTYGTVGSSFWAKIQHARDYGQAAYDWFSVWVDFGTYPGAHLNVMSQISNGGITAESGADHYFNDVYGKRYNNDAAAQDIWYVDLAGSPNSFMLSKSASDIILGNSVAGLGFAAWMGGCSTPGCFHDVEWNYFMQIEKVPSYMIQLENFLLYNYC